MWDCIIVGGGPAGLSGAVYLGRFGRKALIIDAGESRMKRIPMSRNIPGFPDGVSGADLYARMHRHATLYGATFEVGEVRGVEAGEDAFEVKVGARIRTARRVLLATGAHLTEPKFDNLDEALHRGVLRYCPICDGYEARDSHVAVLGGRQGALEEAKFLRSVGARVTYLWLAETPPSDAERADAARLGIVVTNAPLDAVDLQDRVSVRLTSDERATFDVIYPCLGCGPRSDLARRLGINLSPEAGVLVDAHMRTNVEGVYAAGDVLQGLDQIASACGQAAIAATDIHNALRRAEQMDNVRNAADGVLS